MDKTTNASFVHGGKYARYYLCISLVDIWYTTQAKVCFIKYAPVFKHPAIQLLFSSVMSIKM